MRHPLSATSAPSAAILGLLGLMLCSPALADEDAKQICLQPESIRNTTILDDRTILFHMRDGTVWRNSLTDSCPGLKIEGGFAYEVRGGTICGSLQTITVLRSHAFCELGPFSRDPSPVDKG